MKQKEDPGSSTAKVSLVVGGAENGSSHLLDLAMNSQLGPWVPSTLGDFDCFMINVTGPGISNSAAGSSLSANTNSNPSCTYPGVMSQVVKNSTSEQLIDLDVPVGLGRVFQVIGLKLKNPASGCPALPPFGSFQQSDFMGAREVGRTVVAINDDQVLDISAEPFASWSEPICGGPEMQSASSSSVRSSSLSSSSFSSSSSVSSSWSSSSSFISSMSSSSMSSASSFIPYGSSSSSSSEGSSYSSNGSSLTTYDGYETAVVDLDSSFTDQKVVVFNEVNASLTFFDDSDCNGHVTAQLSTDAGTGMGELVVAANLHETVTCSILVSDGPNVFVATVNEADGANSNSSSSSVAGPLTTYDGLSSVSLHFDSTQATDPKVVYFNKPKAELSITPSAECAGVITFNTNTLGDLGRLMVNIIGNHATVGDCLFTVSDGVNSMFIPVDVSADPADNYDVGGTGIGINFSNFDTPFVVGFWALNSSDYHFKIGANLKKTIVDDVEFTTPSAVQMGLENAGGTLIEDLFSAGIFGHFFGAGPTVPVHLDQNVPDSFKASFPVGNNYLPKIIGERLDYGLKVISTSGAQAVHLPLKLKNVGMAPVNVEIADLADEPSLKKVKITKIFKDGFDLTIGALGPETLEGIGIGHTLYLAPDSNPDGGAGEVPCNFGADTTLIDGQTCTFILGNGVPKELVSTSFILNLVVIQSVDYSGNHIGGILQKTYDGADAITFDAETTVSTVSYSVPRQIFLEPTLLGATNDIIVPVLVHNQSNSETTYKLADHIESITLEVPSNTISYSPADLTIDDCGSASLAAVGSTGEYCVNNIHFGTNLRYYPSRITLVLKGEGVNSAVKANVMLTPSSANGVDWASPMVVDSDHFALMMRNVSGGGIYPVEINGFNIDSSSVVYLDTILHFFQYPHEFMDLTHYSLEEPLTAAPFGDGVYRMVVVSKTQANFVTGDDRTFNFGYVRAATSPYGGSEIFTQIEFSVP